VWIIPSFVHLQGLKAAKKPTPVSSPATLHDFPGAQAAESEALCLWRVRKIFYIEVQVAGLTGLS